MGEQKPDQIKPDSKKLENKLFSIAPANKDKADANKPLPKNIQQRIATLKELAIAIDTFEDLFSDFDPRDYSKRDLSDDFLREIKKRYMGVGQGKLEVIFHAPKAIQDDKVQKIILQRIKQHFKNRSLHDAKAINTIKQKGFMYIAFGLILLAAITLIGYTKILSSLQIEIIGIVLLPLGWFGVWEGFSKIVEPSYLLAAELEIDTKLSRASYTFKFLD